MDKTVVLQLIQNHHKMQNSILEIKFIERPYCIQHKGHEKPSNRRNWNKNKLILYQEVAKD